MGGADWSFGPGGWEGLLDFDGGHQQTPAKQESPTKHRRSGASSPTGQTMSRIKSDSAGHGRAKNMVALATRGPYLSQTSYSPGRIAQYGSDLAWKTILSSVVEVESVGATGVARVLQEVWKRGGGDAVSQAWYIAEVGRLIPPGYKSVSMAQYTYGALVHTRQHQCRRSDQPSFGPRSASPARAAQPHSPPLGAEHLLRSSCGLYRSATLYPIRKSASRSHSNSRSRRVTVDEPDSWR